MLLITDTQARRNGVYLPPTNTVAGCFAVLNVCIHLFPWKQGNVWGVVQNTKSLLE